MRICILMQKIQSLGGVQRVVTTIMNRIVETTNIEVTIISPIGNEDKKLFYVDPKIVVVDESNFSNGSNIVTRVLKKINRNTNLLINAPSLQEKVYLPDDEVSRYSDFMDKNDIDAVIGAGSLESILVAKIASVNRRVKAIAWIHSTFESYYLMKGHGTHGLQRLLNNYTKNIARMLVLTKHDREIFTENLTGFRHPPIVFYNPVTIAPKGKSLLDRRKILFVGRINTAPKGCDLLLDIAKLLAEWGLDFELDVVGDGEYLPEMKKEIEKMDLQNYVNLRGESSHVERYYENASVLLVTSRYEGFGLVLTEAMAYGIPVVAFHAEGPDEIIEDGRSGFLIEQYDVKSFAEAVQRLVTDMNLLQKMSDNALSCAKEFDIDVAVNKFTQIVEECVRYE